MCRIIIIAITSVVVVANALQVRGRYESGKQMTDGCKYASVCVCETVYCVRVRAQIEWPVDRSQSHARTSRTSCTRETEPSKSHSE